jgi:hypothetical protein
MQKKARRRCTKTKQGNEVKARHQSKAGKPSQDTKASRWIASGGLDPDMGNDIGNDNKD